MKFKPKHLRRLSELADHVAFFFERCSVRWKLRAEAMERSHPLFVRLWPEKKILIPNLDKITPQLVEESFDWVTIKKQKESNEKQTKTRLPRKNGPAKGRVPRSQSKSPTE